MGKYKVIRFFLNLFAAFFVIGAIVYIAQSNSLGINSAEQNVMTIAGIICIVFFIFCVIFSKKLKKKIKQPIIEAKHQAAERERLECQRELEERNALFKCQGLHVYGLPVVEDAQVICYWCRDRVLFETSGTSFNLSFDKLTDVASKTDKEIQTANTTREQYVSSTGRAIAGYMLLGPVGAAIGGRARKKRVYSTITISTPETYYMILTYVDKGEVKCIVLEMPYKDAAFPFIEAFNQIKPAQTQTFDL